MSSKTSYDVLHGRMMTTVIRNMSAVDYVEGLNHPQCVCKECTQRRMGKATRMTKKEGQNTKYGPGKLSRHGAHGGMSPE